MPQMTLKILLGLLLIAALGCPPGRSGDDDDATSDDDDSAADDDDSTAADDDDSTAADDDDSTAGDDDDSTASGTFSSNPGDLPCDAKESEQIDVWSVALTAGQTLVAQVDTVAAMTTFDPGLSFYEAADPDNGTYLGGGDDEFACTFPPPEFRCPEATYTAAATGPVGIAVENLGCPGTDALAAYVLRVQVDGVPATPTLVLDDYWPGTSTDPPM